MLEGGNGSDVFILTRNGGFDIITDFGNGNDVMDVSNFRVRDGFDGLNLHDDGTGNAVVDFGNASFTLDGIDVSQLSAEDFLF